MFVWGGVYIHICVSMCVCKYIYIEREREREIDKDKYTTTGKIMKLAHLEDIHFRGFFFI